MMRVRYGPTKKRLTSALAFSIITGNKGVTSPKTNLKLDPKKAHVTENVTVRSLIIEYKEAKAREWEEAERRWREQQGVEGEQQQQRGQVRRVL